MAVLDFTTFTETDPNSRYTVTSTKIAVAGLDRSEDAHVYKDFGAAAFNGNFTHKITVYINSASTTSGFLRMSWGLANAINDVNGLRGAAENYLEVYITEQSSTVASINLAEYYGSNVVDSSISLSLSTPYYLTIVRDESVGTYGTLYCYIYSDSARTTLVDTLTLTLRAALDFRYLYGANSFNNSTTGMAFTGYAENLEISPVNVGTIAFTEDDDVVAIVGTIATNTGTIAFTEADDVVAIVGEIPNVSTIAFTENNDVVAIVVNLDVPTAVISFTEDNDVVEVVGSIKNIGTIAFTEDNDVVAIVGGIPTTSYITFTEESDSVSVLISISAVTEPFSVRVHHKTTGAAITGLTTVLLTIRQPSTGYRWDFSDNSFKATPTTATLALDQVSAANQPGLYQSLVTTTTWSGWVEFEATYDDGAYTYSFPGEAYYTNGVRANGSWSVVEWAGVNALPTLAEIEGSSIIAKQVKLDFMQKWVLNKLVESPSGDTVTLYDDDGEILKTWAWNNATKTRSAAT